MVYIISRINVQVHAQPSSCLTKQANVGYPHSFLFTSKRAGKCGGRQAILATLSRCYHKGPTPVPAASYSKACLSNMMTLNKRGFHIREAEEMFIFRFHPSMLALCLVNIEECWHYVRIYWLVSIFRLHINEGPRTLLSNVSRDENNSFKLFLQLISGRKDL